MLPPNKGVAFIGTQKNGPFDIAGATARKWLQQPLNANGRPNADVVKPWRNARSLLQSHDDTWIIDFGCEMSCEEAAFYVAPFAHVATAVKPTRASLRRADYRRLWWRHAEARPGMRRALEPLTRYIATPRVAKHRLFVWLQSTILPDTRIVVIARDDDAFFGLLHSRVHATWALSQASRHGVGNDPTYNSEACFETFPFPEGLTPNIPAADYATDPRAQKIAAAARELVAKRDAWLNPPDLVERVPEVVPDFPDRIVPRNERAAAILRKRTLTALYNMRGTPEGAWLDSLHRALDEAVAEAYGWPPDLSEDELLARLLALNLARAKAENG